MVDRVARTRTHPHLRASEAPARRGGPADPVDDVQPRVVAWEVTRACRPIGFRARTDTVGHRGLLELTGREGRRILDDVAALGPPRPLVALTGGDPLERPDLDALILHAVHLGLRVAVDLAVTPLLNRDAIRRLHGLGVSAISLPLDRVVRDERPHRVDPALPATMQALQDAHDVGVPVQVNTTVTADNATRLPEVLQAVLDVGAQVWSVFFIVPIRRGERLRPLTGNEEEDVLEWLVDVSGMVPIRTTEAPQYQRVVRQRAAARTPERRGALGRHLHEQVIDLLGDRRPARVRRRPTIVNPGNGLIFIDHQGGVYPSAFLPEPVGSVRRDSIVDIYRNAPLLQRLRDPDALGGKCGICEFREICGGSRSRAYAATGDPLSEDPSCVHQPAARIDTAS